MWSEILRLAVGNGLWAVLFCCLLVYQLTDSRKRELKYQQTIESLRASLVAVEAIRKDVELIKSAVTVTEIRDGLDTHDHGKNKAQDRQDKEET